MDIRLVEGQYKSISQLDWHGIPPFAVITGANGAGKTQLLELIARGAGVFVQPPGAFNVRHQSPETFNAKLACSIHLDAQNTVFLRSYWEMGDAAATTQQVRDLMNEAWNARVIPTEPHALPTRNTQWDTLWDALFQATGVSRDEFDLDLFEARLPPNFMLMKEGATQPSTLYSSIPMLFVNYAARVHYLGQKKVSPEEILARLGPLPWAAVNSAMQEAGLQYEMVLPVVVEGSFMRPFDINYRLELRHRQRGTVVPPSALSSGERVIFLTAIWSYFFNQSALNTRAALLLLDEPDAHLHPALTSVFLKVVRSELVERRGLRVIVATHSPSTVALTEEGELFVMSIDSPRIRPVSNKWEAVAHLTAGLVTVGSHTKAVFVEDKHDSTFFQAVQALSSRGGIFGDAFDPARSLNFIPASKDRLGGGKNMVIGWVRSIDTTQVAGIVDRDEDPEPAGRVYAGLRRQLECYLLDPLFVYALLLDENAANRPNFAPGVDHRHSKSLAAVESATLQTIADGMVGIYAEIARPNATDRIAVNYVGGAIVSIPSWVLQCDMKSLFEAVRRKLDVRWDREHLIAKYEVLSIVPVELVTMLVKIQRA